MGNHDHELRDLLESHKHQVSVIHDIHAETIAKKTLQLGITPWNYKNNVELVTNKTTNLS